VLFVFQKEATRRGVTKIARKSSNVWKNRYAGVPFEKAAGSMASGKSLKFFLRLMRHSDTPECVGRGVAAGFFTAMALPGGHMFAAFLLAMLVRGARGTAVLATWIINPFTVPLVWPFQCYLGSFLIGRPLSHALIEKLLWDAIHTPSMKTAAELSGELIASFFAGGLLLGTLLAAFGYFCAIALVRRHRARLAGRKEFRRNQWKLKGHGTCD
jgi:uncharacterized protein (DUF2062 family)